VTDEPNDETRQYEWMIPLRLAAPGESSQELLEHLGLKPLVETAEWCYRVRSAGRSLPPDVVVLDSYSRWLRFAHGLAGSIGESLVVCVGCEVESAILRAAVQRWTEIGERFFSIAASQETIGVGHRLINLAQRAFSARGEYLTLLRSSGDRVLASSAAFDDPRTTDRGAWLSLNTTTARAMKSALRDVPHRSVHAMLDELIELAISDEWRILSEVRGEVFHRSRPESSISSGLDGESGYARAITDHAGKPIGIAVGAWNRYSGGDTRSDQESAATRAALDRVATAVRIVTTAFVKAIEPLSGGVRRAEIEPSGRIRTYHQIGRRWSEENCTCCAPSA
jgi:hypothetical protein